MNTTPSQRLGFLHHIRLVPLFACILGGILVLFALSSALAGYFLWQADRDQRDVTAEIEIRTGLANSSDFFAFIPDQYDSGRGCESYCGNGSNEAKYCASRIGD
ncbi:Tar ligand binding domain-containing protein [Escherichia coli]